MGNCLTIEENLIDLTKKHNASALVINNHTSTIQDHTTTIKQLIETQLKNVELHCLTKEKRRAWEGIYSKDGFSVKITMTNTKMVSNADLENWTEGIVDSTSSTKFRDLYMPQYWFGSSAGSTLRYRFYEKNLELEYKQTVEQMWDSAIEIVVFVSIPVSALSVYSLLEHTEEWTNETTIWQSTNQHLKEEFIKILTPDLMPIRVIDLTDAIDTDSDDESTMGLPIAVVLEYILAQKNMIEWKRTITTI